MKKNISILFFLVIANFTHAQESDYVNPVDGLTYRAEWRKSIPQDEKKEEADRKVKLKQVRLLSSEQEFAENLSVRDLSDFVRAIQNNIEESIGKSSDSFNLLVDVDLSKEKDPKFSTAYQGETTKKLLKKINKKLKKLKGLFSKSENLKLQVHFQINQQLTSPSK